MERNLKRSNLKILKETDLMKSGLKNLCRNLSQGPQLFQDPESGFKTGSRAQDGI